MGVKLALGWFDSRQSPGVYPTALSGAGHTDRASLKPLGTPCALAMVWYSGRPVWCQTDLRRAVPGPDVGQLYRREKKGYAVGGLLVCCCFAGVCLGVER